MEFAFSVEGKSVKARRVKPALEAGRMLQRELDYFVFPAGLLNLLGLELSLCLVYAALVPVQVSMTGIFTQVARRRPVHLEG